MSIAPAVCLELSPVAVECEPIDLDDEPFPLPQEVDFVPIELDVYLRSRKVGPADQIEEPLLSLGAGERGPLAVLQQRPERRGTPPPRVTGK